MNLRSNPVSRRIVLALGFIGALTASAAEAATPAESFIADNIQKGVGILNNRALAAPQRSQQFESLLLGITDMKRVAIFTLGPAAKTASVSDQDAYVQAFQSYSVAVYRSYLGKYAGQSLKVTGSSERAPGDFIVTTNMIDPADHSGQPPMEIDFRVRTDAGKPELTDFSFAGIWLALEERDQFGAFLNQNHGDVPMLTKHLMAVTAQYK